jgi:hypothetical protein
MKQDHRVSLENLKIFHAKPHNISAGIYHVDVGWWITFIRPHWKVLIEAEKHLFVVQFQIWVFNPNQITGFH